MTTYTQTADGAAHVRTACHDCPATRRHLRRDVIGITRWKREHAEACAVRRGRAAIERGENT